MGGEDFFLKAGETRILFGTGLEKIDNCETRW